MPVKGLAGYAVIFGKFRRFSWLRGAAATRTIERDQPGSRRRRAHLAEQRDELPPVIARMIDRVAKHLAECVQILAAGTRLYRHGLVQAPFREPGKERVALRFDCLPARARGGEGRQVPALWDRGIRLREPAVEPQLFRPHDMAQRAVESAVTALQVAEVRFGGERLPGREETPGGPRVGREEPPHLCARP